MSLVTRILNNKLFYVFLAAILLRLFFVFSAFHGDLNNNISWGNIAYEYGLNGFYGSSDANDWPFSAPNQPPLTILLFTFLAFLWNLINKTFWFLNENIQVFPSPLIWFWQEKGMTLLVKLPSIIADMGIGLLIYKYLQNKLKTKKAFAGLCVWLFNPVIIYNSSVWGQTDSVVNYLGLIAILALLERKLTKFGVFITLSILFKGSLTIFIPILFVVFAVQKYKLKTIFSTFYLVLGTIFIVCFWFHPYLDFPVWLINLYAERILPGEIGYLTANAFNFWWLVDSGKTYDSILYLGLPARAWSLIAVLTGNALLILHIFRKKFDAGGLFFTLALSALIAFLFLTRIHERYLYPFFPYATLLLFDVPRMLFGYALISFIYLINLYNLFWLPDVPILVKALQETSLPEVLSVTNILMLVYFMFLYSKTTRSSQQKEKTDRR